MDIFSTNQTAFKIMLEAKQISEKYLTDKNPTEIIPEFIAEMEKAIGELQYQFYQKGSNRNLVVDDAKKIVQKMHILCDKLISDLNGAEPEDVNEANDKKATGGGQQRISIFGKQQVKEIFANPPFKKDGKLIFQTYRDDFDEPDFYAITGGHGNKFYVEWNKRIYEGVLAAVASNTYFQIVTKEEAMPINFNPRSILKKEIKQQDNKTV